MAFLLLEFKTMVTARHFQKDLRFFHFNSGLSDRIWRTTEAGLRWRLFCQALSEIQYKTDFAAHAFVLMGTHFHILFSTRSPKGAALADEFHQNLSQLCGGQGDALEIPLFCHTILSAKYYRNAYKYVYRNPVEAGLCRTVQEFEYSSLKGLLGRRCESAPVIDNVGLIYAPAKVLEWLNTPFAEAEEGWVSRERGGD